jgi:hypothetical protein
MCAARGLALATLSSVNLTNALLAAIRPFETAQFPTGQPFWIGGSDAATEGIWVWVDETIWSYTRWITVPGWQQPDEGTASNCLQQTTDPQFQGGWADDSCLDKLPFLCSPPGEAPRT